MPASNKSLWSVLKGFGVATVFFVLLRYTAAFLDMYSSSIVGEAGGDSALDTAGYLTLLNILGNNMLSGMLYSIGNLIAEAKDEQGNFDYEKIAEIFYSSNPVTTGLYTTNIALLFIAKPFLLFIGADSEVANNVGDYCVRQFIGVPFLYSIYQNMQVAFGTSKDLAVGSLFLLSSGVKAGAFGLLKGLGKFFDFNLSALKHIPLIGSILPSRFAISYDMKGLGLTDGLSQILSWGIMKIGFACSNHFRKCNLNPFKWRFNKTTKEISTLGAPIGVQAGVEGLSMAGMYFMAGIGQNIHAAESRQGAFNIIMQFALPFFYGDFAFSHAAGIRTTNALKSSNTEIVRTLGGATLAGGTAISAIPAAAFIFFHNGIIRIFISKQTEDPEEIIREAFSAGQLIIYSLSADMFRVNFNGLLRGFKRTFIPGMMNVLLCAGGSVGYTYLCSDKNGWAIEDVSLVDVCVGRIIGTTATAIAQGIDWLWQSRQSNVKAIARKYQQETADSGNDPEAIPLLTEDIADPQATSVANVGFWRRIKNICCCAPDDGIITHKMP